MEQAIKKAIEGGWHDSYKQGVINTDGVYELLSHNGSLLITMSSIIIDPLFWQALGKALGWGDYAPYELYKTDPESHKLNSWRWHAIDFMANIMDGKSPDSFFEELIK